MHHVPRKDNDAADFLMKLANRREPSTDGVFVNDLHEPSAHIQQNPTQTHSNTNLALGGSDPPTCPEPDRALGGSDLGASMATLPGDSAIMAVNPAN